MNFYDFGLKFINTSMIDKRIAQNSAVMIIL